MLINLPSRLREFALFVLRVVAGFYMFIGHGWGKITAGPERWTELGGTMELIGISFLPVVWGFLAAIGESVAALFVAFGFLTRTAALFTMGTMGMAATMHVMTSDGWIGHGSAEMSLLYLLIFATIFLAGPGKYSIDHRMKRRR